MRIYTVSRGERLVAAAHLDGDFVDLQGAYAAHLLASGACETGAAAARIARGLLPHDIVAIIAGGRQSGMACDDAIAYAQSTRADRPPFLVRREEIHIEAPLQRPGKFLCIGLNYREHARESGAAFPAEPVFFNKFATSIAPPYGQVVHQGPAVTSKLDYEVELGVVIGRRVKNVDAREAAAAVFGYTVVNDISARDLQHRDGQWVKGKALDSYGPMGPCIVTTDEIAEPGRLRLSLSVNGEVRQNSDTSELIFPVPELISYLSRLMTLEPGDIISTGTPSGVGGAAKPPRFLVPGDVVRAEVEGIGYIEHEIVAGA